MGKIKIVCTERQKCTLDMALEFAEMCHSQVGVEKGLYEDIRRNIEWEFISPGELTRPQIHELEQFSRLSDDLFQILIEAFNKVHSTIREHIESRCERRED